MRTFLRCSPVLLLFVPSWAYALTMEFITYNAFDETVAAFKRLGLIVSDPGFIILAACFVAVTCIGNTIFFGTQALGGRGGNPMSLIVPFLIGIVLFWGTVLPKGALQIYDPVRNKTEAVPDIPAVLVLLAGGLSAVEKGMVQMVDTASATPYKDDVGGISYSMIFSAIKASTPSINLDRSLAQYFKDCGMTAIGSGYNGASMERVMRGAPGWDLYSEYANWNHPSWPTVWFPDGNEGGVPGTCGEAWNYLEGKLSGSITSTMQPMKQSACEQAGFTWSDATERAACDAAMIRGAQMFDPGIATSETWLRSIAMGKSISLALNDPDFSTGINTLVDRQMMSEAFGASEAMNQWIPRLRGIMIAIAVGVAPICLLFVATPMVMRALSVVAGLFIWLALWGICDVIAVQMQQDAAFDAFTEVKRHALGYQAIMNAPEGAVAALGVFGKARTMAMVLATVLTGGLFKLASSYAFTSMGQQWQGDFNQGGEAAGKQRLQIEQQAALQEQLNSAPGTMGRLQQFGYDANVGASSFGAQQNLAQFDYLAGVSGGDTGRLAYQAGEISGGQTLGNVVGHQEIAGGLQAPLSAASAAVAAANTSRSGGSAIGSRERAGDELYGIGKTEGTAGVARTEVERDLSGGFAGATEGDRLKALTRQRESSTAAMSTESGFEPSRAQDFYGFDFARGFAYRETAGDLGVSPERLGRAEGTSGAAHAVATERVADSRGFDAMAAGDQFRMTQTAVTGTTAQHLGGVDEIGGRIAQVDTTGQAARAEMRQKIADYFAPGAGIEGLREAEMKHAGLWNGSVSGGAADRMISGALERGAIDDAQADVLRRQLDERGSVGLAATFDQHGDPVNWSMSGIASGDFGSTVDTRYRRMDSVEAGHAYTALESAQGGAALLDPGHVEALMQRAFRLDGSTDQAGLAAFGQGYSGALEARGFTISGQSAEDFRMGVTGQARGEVGGSVRAGTPKFVPAGIEGHISGGLSAFGDVARSWSDTNTIGTNEGLLLTQALGANAVEEAKQEYIKDHGSLPSENTLEYRQATQAIYNRAGELFRDDFETLATSGKENTEWARKGNEMLEDAEKLLERSEKFSKPDAESPKPGSPDFGRDWRLP